MRARLRGRPLASVVPIGIGHNNGPPMATRWGKYTWRRAHAKAWETPSPEVVKLRQRRAAELGLTYRQIASIAMELGRTPSAVVFRLDDLLVAGANRGTPDLRPEAFARLRMLARPRLFVVADTPIAAEAAEAAVAMIVDAAEVVIAGWAAAASPGEIGRTAVELLARFGVAPSSALLVTSTAAGGDAAERARFAAVLRADDYFRQPNAG